MSERMKPPARRAGRTLGGAKKATPPPPPPAAELTPEQFAAEQAAAQGEGRPAASEPHVQPAPVTVPAEASAQGRTEAVPEVAQSSAQPTAEATGPVPEPTVSQSVRPAIASPELRTGAGGEPKERQVPPVVPGVEPAVPSVQPTQPAEPAVQHGPSPATSAAAGAAPAAEVAVRPAVPPVAGGTAFPIRNEGPGAHQEQDIRSQEAPSEGAPYAHGPGRPKDIPEVAVVLNQRIIARESLDSSVPAALKLKKRIKRFALDNELDHLPIGDIVSVALDEWLSARGF
ncbi:hypothetical protein OG616_37860 [Streptomyces antibioticus]|uniref:hypothetical protein n=1 Tax=Streptomyces antibioticus TaxID=1890 RepID=UPI002251AF1A|nr:hypothetical protein [Streptomyces antibioticus]MCX5173379.1 hypothetical protein [Streptomyces antibioticus]MCX5173756.1 hypothetical protein [Streptomyces antibioticus]